MITRRIVLAGAAALAFTTSASAEDWKAKYPEITFAVIPAENASGGDQLGIGSDAVMLGIGRLRRLDALCLTVDCERNAHDALPFMQLCADVAGQACP